MGYLQNPVLFPYKFNLSAADCLAGGIFFSDQFPVLPVNQFYYLAGAPVVYYNFNSIDFDAVNLSISYRTATPGNYYYRGQLTTFTGFSCGNILQGNQQNGALVDVVLTNDQIICEITSPATVGNGSLLVTGYAGIMSIV